MLGKLQHEVGSSFLSCFMKLLVPSSYAIITFALMREVFQSLGLGRGADRRDREIRRTEKRIEKYQKKANKTAGGTEKHQKWHDKLVIEVEIRNELQTPPAPEK
jgi:hypothetical protein